MTLCGSRPELTVVLPGYNERAALAAAVDAYRASFTRHGIDFELLVIDDASTDGMGELADRLAMGDSRIRVLHHERNQGQVAGILHGFREARGCFLTHNGMDLPFNPNATETALALLREGADVVVVERRDRKSYGTVRRVLSWLNVLVLKAVFRSPFRDHNFVQFFRREVVAALPVRTSGVSTVTPELILRALSAGYRVVNATADYHPRQSGRSTITPGMVFRTTRELVRLWQVLRQRHDPRPTAQNAAGPCSVRT
jgi:dolichol-phosphate mannosyltransferase